MSAKRKPIQLFVSYSHRDRKHLDRLRTHLAGLQREARVNCWWDGTIEVGRPWAPQIREALISSDIVLLLLTANFVASDYCIEEELRVARERERRGEIDLVPILIEPFDLGAHWLGQLQAITVNGKAVTQTRLGEAAWEQVARQIRLKVECIEGKRPAMQVLHEVEEVVHSGEVQLGDLPAERRRQVVEFASVSTFWRAKSDQLPKCELVTVPGTLSQLAPMLMGSPTAKRVLHREFRHAIETHRRFGERKRLTINACMSISSGQMVHRDARHENRKRLVGLYESIARNSIPVFVLPEYYDRELAPMFEGGDTDCFEAIVTGRLFLLDNNYIRRILARQGLDRILSAAVVDDLCRDAFALEVGSRDTGIRRLLKQPARYLDGDIWLALKSDLGERFITSFVDITNKAEREEEMDRMRRAAGVGQILATYNELQSIGQLLGPDSGG